MATPTTLSNLSKREAITDAVYRAILGLDTNDFALFKSAWLDEADIVFALNETVMTGMAEIKKNIMDFAGPLDTTHTISNVRVDVKDGADTAVLYAHAVAQHFRAGEGPDPSSKGMLTGSLYNIDLVQDKSDGQWKFKKWTMKVIWLNGDASVVGR